jgi:glycosyltransferase involved in cell wall biosynthesis
MKILYCIGSLAQTGGTEKVLANKANYFSEKLGWDIHILINDQKDKPYAYTYNKAIKIHDMKISSYLSAPIIPYFSYKRLQSKASKLFEAKIKSISPDVIVVTQHGIEDFIIPKLKLNIPTVREFHFAKKAIWETAKLIPNALNRQLFIFKKKRILRKMNGYDHIVLLTKSDQDYGNYGTKTTVIPNMLDISIDDLKENKDTSTSPKRVISVGSMHDMRKGFDIQIDLWKKIAVKHPDWILDIYGDGVERSNLQKMVDASNLTGKVILHGNTNAIMSKYKASSFFLMTSIAEGLPMVIIEAMSCGLPCVAFDCPEGPRDIITNSKDGFVIENRDTEVLFNKVDELITNPEMLKTFSNNAAKASKLYSIENISEIWIDFFNKIKK